MGLEPVGAEAKRTLGRGLHRATGAPSVGGAKGERVEAGHFLPARMNRKTHHLRVAVKASLHQWEPLIKANLAWLSSFLAPATSPETRQATVRENP